MTKKNEPLFVYGVQAVQKRLALAAIDVKELYVSDKKISKYQSFLEQAQDAGIPSSYQSLDFFERHFPQAVHQGIAVRVKNLSFTVNLDDLLVQLISPAHFLILERIQDPYNLGACCRVAEAAGVDAVIVSKDQSASVTAVTAKAAAGALATLPIITVTNMSRCLTYLQKAGVWIFGTDGDAPISLYDTDLTGPVAWVLGNEGQGLKHLTKQQCDVLCNIPMAGHLESLNVSTAAAVCTYELVRQRLAERN